MGQEWSPYRGRGTSSFPVRGEDRGGKTGFPIRGGFMVGDGKRGRGVSL